jgi:hypothetical protein
MNFKRTAYWCSARLWNRALALFVALSTVTSSASLFAKDHEDKDKTRDRQSNVPARGRDMAEVQEEDLNVKTDPEKFIRNELDRKIKIKRTSKQS